MANDKYGPTGIWENQQYQNPLRRAADEAVESVRSAYSSPEYAADRQAARQNITDSDDFRVLLRDARRNEPSMYERRKEIDDAINAYRMAPKDADGFYQRGAAVMRLKALRDLYGNAEGEKAGDLYDKVSRHQQARNSALFTAHDNQANRVKELEGNALAAASYQRNYDQLQSPLSFANALEARRQAAAEKKQAMEDRLAAAQAKLAYGDELGSWIYGGGSHQPQTGQYEAPLGIPSIGGLAGQQLAKEQMAIAAEKRAKQAEAWMKGYTDNEVDEIMANGTPEQKEAVARSRYMRDLQNAARQLYSNPLDMANVNVPPSRIQVPRGAQHVGDFIDKTIATFYNPLVASWTGLPKMLGWGEYYAYDPEGKQYAVDKDYLRALYENRGRFGEQNVPRTKVYDLPYYMFGDPRPELLEEIGEMDTPVLYPLQQRMFR